MMHTPWTPDISAEPLQRNLWRSPAPSPSSSSATLRLLPRRLLTPPKMGDLCLAKIRTSRAWNKSTSACIDRFMIPLHKLETTEPKNQKNNLKRFYHLSTLSPLTDKGSTLSVAGLDTYGIRNTMFSKWLSLSIYQLYRSLKFEEFWLSCHTWKTSFYLSPLNGENNARLLQPSTLHTPLSLQPCGIWSFSTEDRDKKKKTIHEMHGLFCT